MKIKIFILVLILFLSGCTKEGFKTLKPGQEIYFEVEGLNYAWGIYHAGILIDSLGMVRGYDHPGKWNFQDALGNISGSKMKENIEQTDTLITLIPKDTLYKYINKIYSASEGHLTDPVIKMVDAGVTRYSAYLYDLKTDKYSVILLKQTGDQFIDNQSQEANQIYNWLIRIKFR
jgi:hypothetical protein